MGQRPDQYHKDLGEASDKPFKPGLDAHLHEAAKQDVSESRADAERDNLIPKGGENPALADLKARREEQQRADGETAE